MFNFPAATCCELFRMKMVLLLVVAIFRLLHIRCSKFQWKHCTPRPSLRVCAREIAIPYPDSQAILSEVIFPVHSFVNIPREWENPPSTAHCTTTGRTVLNKRRCAKKLGLCTSRQRTQHQHKTAAISDAVRNRAIVCSTVTSYGTMAITYGRLTQLNTPGWRAMH